MASNEILLLSDAQKFPSKYFTEDNQIRPSDTYINYTLAQACNTSPIELIPAQGSGKVIVPISLATILLNYNGTPYSAADSKIIYSGGTQVFATITQDVFEAVVNKLRIYTFAAGPLNMIENEAIQFKGNGNFTGNGSTFLISFLYRVLTLV